MSCTRSWLAGGFVLLGASVLHVSGVPPTSRVPGGTLNEQGGVGVPGDVPGGTLGGQVPGGTLGGQVPGGTLEPLPGTETAPFFPGLVVPEPAPLPGFGDGSIDDPQAQWPPPRAWRGGRAGTVQR
jgi:hypothetical protein